MVMLQQGSPPSVVYIWYKSDSHEYSRFYFYLHLLGLHSHGLRVLNRNILLLLTVGRQLE